MKHRLAIFVLLSGLVVTLLLTDQPVVYISVILGLLLGFSILVLIGVTTMKWNYFIPSLNRVQPGKIAFTFDDGPHENTLAILNVLKKQDVKATFFVIGKNCEKHPEILKAIVDQGHIVGNHSFSHQNNLGWASTKTIEAEIDKTNAVIEKITGIKPHYYRPPFGITNPNIARAIKRANMTSVGWTIRSFDTVIKNADKLVEKVLPRLNKNGNIILMHDTIGESADALDRLISLCKEKGIEIVNITNDQSNAVGI